MKIKNITILSLLVFIILLFPIYWYINSNDQDININGIKAVKSNLQNYKIIPIEYYNRTVGEAKFRIDELGSKYLFTLLYCFLEKILLNTKKNMKD